MALSFSLRPAKPLQPQSAVAAIIVAGDGRYLMQHRDAKDTIFYPDHWGCFGGAIEPGESAEAALRRELQEELELTLEASPPQAFSSFQFDLKMGAPVSFDRIYFEVKLPLLQIADLKLGEGQNMELIDGHDLLHNYALVPYDAFAIWMHYYNGMLISYQALGQ